MNELKLFELARNGDKKAKEKIVSDNEGLVWSIARRFIGRGYDLEDIFQIGCIGLLKAIDRFDESFMVQFSTYAVPLISGEIKRFLRDNGMIKVSRILKQNGYKISKAREELVSRYGREATIEEISKVTNLSIEEIVMATEANREIESIYQTVYNGEGNEMYLVDKYVDEDKNEEETEELINKMLISEVMGNLDERDKKIIEMRYFQDKTQTQVAKEMGISQVQVSRMEKKILQNMKNIIDN